MSPILPVFRLKTLLGRLVKKRPFPSASLQSHYLQKRNEARMVVPLVVRNDPYTL